MKYEVLFIQGAGEETVAAEEPMVNALHKSLGQDFHIRHPRMPDAGNPKYNNWKESIKQEIGTASSPLILLGHSLGGSILLKLFSEDPVPDNVLGMILFGVPFWGTEDWKFEEFEIGDQALNRLRNLHNVYLYHSRDDEEIPFSHLERYQRALPDAKIKIFSETNHSYNNALETFTDDIKALAGQSSGVYI